MAYYVRGCLDACGLGRGAGEISFFANHSQNHPSFLVDAHKHNMADQEPGSAQDEQPKMEDANAPINIKVRAHTLSLD